MNLERLKRLLVLIPLAHRHGPDGIPVEEALRVLGLGSRDALVREVEQLTLVGDPNGTPGDFLDAAVEDDRLRVFLPQAFAHPPRFTSVEAAALLAALRPLQDTGLSEVDAVAHKLRAALPAQDGGELEAALLQKAARVEAQDAPAFRPELEEAISLRAEVEVDYFALSSGEKGTRTLWPRTLLLHGGHWYLAAWNPQKEEEHLYRLDRMSGVRRTGRTFEAHPGPSTERYALDQLYLPSGQEQDVLVRFSRRIGHVAETHWPETAERNADGTVTVRAHLGGDHFLLAWVLGYGGEVEVLEPASLRVRLGEQVAALQALYGP